MDFTEYKCPVCNEHFTTDDDIVVCPECGTPHHRECYEKSERCYYEEKHKEGFTFGNEHETDDNGSNATKVCPKCNATNPKEMFYCQSCGFPLDGKNNSQNDTANNQQQNPYGQPFGPQNMPPFGVGMGFDPMAGIDINESIADGVTAGEMSKFVGKSTPYFLMVFKRIKDKNASRFNFASFFFSGVYFLYRKMIGLGILFSAIILGMYVATYYVYLTPAYQEISRIIMQDNPMSIYSLFYFNTSSLSLGQNFIYNLPNIFSIITLAVRIICGAIANRSYYKHCVKTIKKVKSEDSTTLIGERLEQSGGINFPLAICIGAVFLVVTYIPLFLT